MEQKCTLLNKPIKLIVLYQADEKREDTKSILGLRHGCRIDSAAVRQEN